MATIHFDDRTAGSRVSASHIVIGALDLPFIWAARISQRRELRELLAQEDRIFADIGLKREDVAREAAKPFWRG